MCQKAACAEGHVVVPTNHRAVWSLRRAGPGLSAVGGPPPPGGQGRVESPTAGPPSAPPGRPHPDNAGRGGARLVLNGNSGVFYWAGRRELDEIQRHHLC
jgi:hypothetical protein